MYNIHILGIISLTLIRKFSYRGRFKNTGKPQLNTTILYLKIYLICLFSSAIVNKLNHCIIIDNLEIGWEWDILGFRKLISFGKENRGIYILTYNFYIVNVITSTVLFVY